MNNIATSPIPGRTGRAVHAWWWTAEMIGDDPVRHPAFLHVLRDIARPTATIDKATDQGPVVFPIC